MRSCRSATRQSKIPTSGSNPSKSALSPNKAAGKAPMTTPEPLPDPAIPRVLLFGHRGAGKSALIGALLQAGETQGETLRGEVVHSSVDLPRIRDAVYGGKPIEPSQR